MKVIIVGGVAGGASCAARLRRLDEDAEILMVERGPYVSYANCGLPYHVGSVIEHESDLLVASPEVFRRHFNVDCRTGCEASGSRPGTRPCNCATSRPEKSPPSPTTSSCSRPGAPSVRPPLPGIDLPGIFAVRTVPDARRFPTSHSNSQKVSGRGPRLLQRRSDSVPVRSRGRRRRPMNGSSPRAKAASGCRAGRAAIARNPSGT